ncbi:MAG: hypothetical protein R2800_09815 [Flavipsychrobacter sp.]
MAKDLELKDGTLTVRNGDFVVSDSELVHIEHILKSSKGDWKNAPLLGVGISRWVNGNNQGLSLEKLATEIELQLILDGYKPLQVQVNSLSDIRINAERINQQ